MSIAPSASATASVSASTPATVQDVEQLLAHEQIAALGMLQPLRGLSQPVLGPALSLDDERPFARSAPPQLGEATLEQLLAG